MESNESETSHLFGQFIEMIKKELEQNTNDYLTSNSVSYQSDSECHDDESFELFEREQIEEINERRRRRSSSKRAQIYLHNMSSPQYDYTKEFLDSYKYYNSGNSINDIEKNDNNNNNDSKKEDDNNNNNNNNNNNKEENNNNNTKTTTTNENNDDDDDDDNNNNKDDNNNNNTTTNENNNENNDDNYYWKNILIPAISGVVGLVAFSFLTK
jgi:hypothetical protein